MGLFKKTVDGIISDITARITQLRVVGDIHEAEIAVHNDVVALHARLSELAQVESARARRLADKFEELIK